MVDRVELVSYAWPTLELEIDCGSGTYIRSILRDVGDLLACGALMTALVRTRIGPFLLADSLDPTGLDPSSIPSLLRLPSDAVSDLFSLTISHDDILNINQGRPLASPPATPDGEIALLGPDGALVALAESGSGLIRPKKVFTSG